MDLHDIVSQIKKVSKELGKTPSIIEFVKRSNVSKRQINKHGWNKLCKMAGLKPNKNSQQKESVILEQRAPKIFCFDMEILAMVVKSYGLWNQNIRPSRILKDWSVLSWAGKFLDEDKVYYYDTRKRKDKRDDRILMTNLHKQLCRADIILGHNSDRFDIKKANAKFLEYGLEPVSFSKQIDTLKIARKYFKLSSNSLDFIAKKLGVTPKRKSRKFTNEEMWDECEEGNLEAFEENELYNKQDVFTTIEVFDKLKAWDESINFQAYHGVAICVCGCKEFTKSGFQYTKQGAYRRFRCKDCGKYFKDKSNWIDKETRKTFYK